MSAADDSDNGAPSKLQEDIKTLTKKATGLLGQMSAQLQRLRERHQQLAAEQSSITVQLAPASDKDAPQDEGAGAPDAPPPQEVERDVAFISPFIHREVVQHGLGLPGKEPVRLPSQVTPGSWQQVLLYSRFHVAPGRSDKERKLFDERFIKMDTNQLCELTSAADALDMRSLVDLASRAIARLIEGKTPEQIRDLFLLPDDLTEEEKLEPLRTMTDDPRIRLLNRLYSKKRKELMERKAAAAVAAAADSLVLAPTPSPGRSDDRPLEELLSFIEEGPSRSGSKGKAKKKKARSLKGIDQEASEAGADAEGPASSSAAAAAEGASESSLPWPHCLLERSAVELAGGEPASPPLEAADLDIDHLQVQHLLGLLSLLNRPVTALCSLSALQPADAQRRAASAPAAEQQQQQQDAQAMAGQSSVSAAACTTEAWAPADVDAVASMLSRFVCDLGLQGRIQISSGIEQQAAAAGDATVMRQVPRHAAQCLTASSGGRLELQWQLPQRPKPG